MNLLAQETLIEDRSLKSEEVPLGENEATLRLLIESFKDTAIFMLDPDGRILSWNLGAQRVKGYTSSDIIGRHLSIFYPLEDIANKKPEKELEIAAKLGRYEDEGWRVRKDGSHFWASVNIFSVRDSSGKLKGYSKLVSDLTDRGQLKKLEDIQRATFNIVEDLSTERLRIENIQSASFNILEDFFEEQQKLQNLQKAAFNILEDLSIQKDKLTREIHERQRIEKALEGSNKDLESFCYSVSHDLRAPLRHIAGFVDLLVTRCRDDLNENGLHYLDAISTSAQQMSVLIDDLLKFSRTGRVEMRKELVDMNKTVREALTMVEGSDGGRTIEWNIADLPPVHGDYGLLRQVWANLLDNAIKFTRIRKVARIVVNCRRENDEFIFMMADNGVGFDQQYAGKLFGVFQRLHPVEKFEGTGIGLATVQRIVTRHGGRVWAEGKLDQGTKIYFTLPIFQESRHAGTKNNSSG